MPAKDVTDPIRRVISADEAKELLDHIKGWESKPKTQWKARANAHQAALETGDPLECAKVLKDLNQLESEGNLRQHDRVHLKQSLDLLIEEISQALGKRRGQTRKLIFEAVGA
jgi:RNA polymerase-interacting CarD/CdnL/TRCF family regulator